MWGYDYRNLVSRKLGLSQDLVRPHLVLVISGPGQVSIYTLVASDSP